MVTTDFSMYMLLCETKNVDYVTELRMFEAAWCVQEQCVIVDM